MKSNARAKLAFGLNNNNNHNHNNDNNSELPVICEEGANAPMRADRATRALGRALNAA